VSTLAVAQLPAAGGCSSAAAAGVCVSWGQWALRVMLTGFFLSVFQTCRWEEGRGEKEGGQGVKGGGRVSCLLESRKLTCLEG
jgi:hypothetical protein